MAMIEYPVIFLLLTICFLSLCWLIRNGSRGRTSSSMPTNWPLVGMTPALLRNAHRVHEFATEILKESGGTFEFKGPWFSNMDMLVTCDPSNVHHMLSRNFANYPKGPEFRKIFDIFGDGIFNADDLLWEVHRKTTMSIMRHSDFYSLLERTVWHKVEKGLLPLLEHYTKLGAELDLQEVFQRLAFDSISMLVLDNDPASLSIELPLVPCEKAFNDTMEALLHRHMLPETCWQLQNRFRIGKEKKLIRAREAFDSYIYPCISPNQPKQFGLLTSFVEAFEKQGIASAGNFQKFLKDTFLNLMVAGRDTTSAALTWFFWLVSVNPSVRTKILEEIESKLQGIKENKRWRCFSVEESRKLVYLHGVLCETLRLFPSVALEHKAPVETDTLPSGHHVKPNTKIILSFYSMGRMESIWGEDCAEFKPERWISERGGNRHEPSYKFPAFNAGPRTCLGKEMAFIQMKMVAATIIFNYQVELVEGHPVSPSDSIIIQMKHGLKVRLSKRIRTEVEASVS